MNVPFSGELTDHTMAKWHNNSEECLLDTLLTPSRQLVYYLLVYCCELVEYVV